MSMSSALLSTEPVVYPKGDPRLKLLIELEPRYRVFFGNLIDLVSPRREPPLFLASQPVPSRKYFFVRTGVRWPVIAESIAWHLAAIPLFVSLWILSLRWEQRYSLQPTRTDLSQAHLTYNPPVNSFPAHGSSSPKIGTHGKPGAAPHQAIRVASEGKPGIVAPPNVRLGGSGRPDLASANPALPAVPLSAISRSRPSLPAGANAVVGPPPSLNQVSSRTGPASSQTSVVAPAPQVGSIRGGHGVAAPSAAAVAPAPVLDGPVRGLGSSNINIGHSAAVAPAPVLPMHEQQAGWGIAHGTPGGTGVAVVPPPPSVGGVVLAGGNGNSLSGSGTQVVPPAPSLGNSDVFGSGGAGGGKPLTGLGGQAIPPAPSVGRSILAGSGGNSLAGAGTQVVPPAPSIGGSGIFDGHGGGNGRGGSFHGTGTGEQALGPPAIGNGEGGTGGLGTGSGHSAGTASGTGSVSGNGGLSGIGSTGDSLSGDGTGTGSGGLSSTPGSGAGGETMAGLASGSGVGPAQGRGTQAAPVIRAAVPPPPPQVVDEPGGTTRELPLRIVQLALALPMSSYFSNYEAFVAERTVNNDATQLIKLVYIFMPYQKRLAEYGISTSKKFKLRVTRDPSCDESLLSMTWPDAGKAAQPAKSEESDKLKLPCYRTTAEDYGKAIARALK